MADSMQAIAAAGDARGRTGVAARSATQSAHVLPGCNAKACRALAPSLGWPPVNGVGDAVLEKGLNCYRY